MHNMCQIVSNYNPKCTLKLVNPNPIRYKNLNSKQVMVIERNSCIILALCKLLLEM